MKNKQVGGLIAAVLVFCFIETVQMAVENFSGNYEENYDSSYDENEEEAENWALVEVKGEITDAYDDYYDYYYETAPDFYQHQPTIDLVDALIDDEENQGILLYIDSPGGEVYQSDELYLKLLQYKEETGRPIWAYTASEACSGGYYVAMASDKIYSNRNGILGSIGVIMTVEDYSGMMEEMGVKEQQIVSGPNKAMGSGTKPLTEEQLAIFQGMVDESYEQFVEIVAEGRHMPVAEVKKVADGRIYSARQAKEVGLIDEVSTFDEMKEEFREFLETSQLDENESDAADDEELGETESGETKSGETEPGETGTGASETTENAQAGEGDIE